MEKARVLFPSVEAGMGHIVPMESVADIFQQKYGGRTEVIRQRFFNEDATEAMKKLEDLFVHEVNMHNRVHGYGKASFMLMDLFSRDSLKCIMQCFVRESYRDGLKKMSALDADLVFSTHWATSYYATRIEDKPINVQYCPDARLDIVWNTGADLTFIPAQKAIDKAKKKKVFASQNIRKTQFIIRKEAFGVPRDKLLLKRELGLLTDRPTITLADGGYGAGKLKKTVLKLLKSRRKLNVVAVCGKNEKLHNQLKKAEVSENVNFVNLSFTKDMLKYVAAADIFMGKAGASSMAEPRFFGVPAIVTMFATPIERDNAKYYIEEVGCAVKELRVSGAVKRAYYLLDNPDEYERLRLNALKENEANGAERVADALFELLKKNFVSDSDGNITRNRIDGDKYVI